MDKRRYLLMAGYMIVCVPWSALCNDYSIAPFNIVCSWGAALFYLLKSVGRSYLAPAFTLLYLLFTSLLYFFPRLFLVTFLAKKRWQPSYLILIGIHVLGVFAAFLLRAENEDRTITEGMTILLYIVPSVFAFAYLKVDWHLTKRAVSIHSRVPPAAR